jgi:hypothetical protein
LSVLAASGPKSAVTPDTYSLLQLASSLLLDIIQYRSGVDRDGVLLVQYELLVSLIQSALAVSPV